MPKIRTAIGLRGLLAILLVAIVAAAWATGGWWSSSPPGDGGAHPGLGVAHAAIGDKKTCATCHASQVTDACADCHAQASLPSLVTPGADIDFLGHHPTVGPGLGFPVDPNCQNPECHSGTVGDARFAFRQVFTGSQTVGHGYCWTQCHDGAKAQVPTCAACHSGETYGTLGSHPSHTSPNSKSWSTAMACGSCHDTSDYPTFSDGQDLAGTGVCDTCHSPGGTYDGVDSAAGSVGAKDNWTSRVYNGSHSITSGKERWCAGCHDASVGGKIDIVGSGFYTTGHGKTGTPAEECAACHDTTVTDYPLTETFTLSYLWSGTASTEMALCFSCHSYSRYHDGDGDNTFGKHRKHVERKGVSCYACHAAAHTKGETGVTVLANNMIKVGGAINATSGSFDGNGTCWAPDSPAADCHGGGAGDKSY